MPHFFITSENIKNKKILLSDRGNYNHIVKSLRAKIGEPLIFIDENEIQYEAKIDNISSNSIEALILKSYKSKRKLDFELFLAQSPLRSDAQSFIAEKATELGAAGLYPIFTDNCALKKSVIEQKIQKWQKIMFEASKQCERVDIPECFGLTDLKRLVTDKTFDRIVAFVERDADFSLKNYMRQNPIKKGEKVLVIIGPEGGFSEKEFEFFKSQKITTLSLGNLILRAETAVITAIGNIIYEFE